MAEIIRTPTRATGGITAAEREAMAAHARLWIDRAFRTDPIDPEKITPAIHGIYEAAKLPRPRVVIVPSPYVMALAGGIAAAVWKKRAATDATREATASATREATDAATREATDAATREATDAATYVAYAATYDATRAATYAATEAAADDATRADVTDAASEVTQIIDAEIEFEGALREAVCIAARNAVRKATDDKTFYGVGADTYNVIDAFNADHKAIREAIAADVNHFGDDARNAIEIEEAVHGMLDERIGNALRAAKAAAAGESWFNVVAHAFGANPKVAQHAVQNWHSDYQGGNMWAGYECYLTAMRDIIGLKLPEYETYSCWEQAAIEGSCRYMHEEFCMVSDFPEVLRVDAENRPHCEDGPSHRWRDGWSLYHWHGVSIPREWIEDRASLTPEIALTWPNIEQRRAACEILGWGTVLSGLDAKVIDADPDPEIGELVEVVLPEIGRERFLRVRCGTGRDFALPMPPDVDTALDANAWSYGYSAEDFLAPEVRT